ncbi:hypothetical protein PLICRDRAFT_661155 [Plicaturopsis crispa FD-325 SS-3]|nr:hypothetical protein PLICRDRAFT_661155 [Plicaturopsis crispa FD-325 SS-3]
MSAFIHHLEFLTGSADSAPGFRTSAQDWQRYRESLNSTEEQHFDEQFDDVSEERWESVVDASNNGERADAQPLQASSSIVSLLIAKPNLEPLLPSLRKILASSSSDDAISAELAELIGFEDIELVMQILNNRTSVAQELANLSAGEGRALPNGGQSKHNEAQEDPTSLAPKDARRRLEKTLRENAARPLFTGTAGPEAEILPHVYTSSAAGTVQGNVLSQFGSKYMLPLGTTRHDFEDYQEVIIPPARPVPPRHSERLIPVSELDPLAKGSFPGYESLNRIQSIVYPTAYRSNENMLICAPTGAGKTDVAMLTILRVLDQHRNTSSPNAPIRSTINRNEFKIIYVAPMKALASEITRKLGKRLQWLGVAVRELTGDMQMTKTEIADTQIIVTTPEKWDVVTRKPTGEGEIASRLKLLIIDEVHLLNEERGAVIETIVARTLRQVESSQSVIRIVGLSATLPNYIDVAEFLSVSRYTGLFYFDSSFRPIPLEQHFLGVRGKPNSPQSRKNLDRVCYEKVSELVKEGHQVMVFVHARKETVKTALGLKELAMTDGIIDDFTCDDHPQWDFFRRSIGESRNKEMKQMFDYGFGIHHAGMLREDRNKMERLFEARAIKVLCCTATLAWGVNLPAHAGKISRTQVYDSSKGKFVDLSVLDVLQVFGRAGRPGLETSGEGYICTTEDKLAHYLDAVTSQNPIESQFTGGMVDSLNAEISLGTVANTHDAVQWLGYTYLFVRMRKNPWQYGILREAGVDDPQLGNKRHELVTTAARRLADARMILFDQQTGAFTITDLGRIAAKYYIRHTSIEIFNKEFRPRMTEADVLAMLCMSTEFDQIQVRENEVKELELLMEIIPCAVKGGTDTSQGKVNILLQGYISRQPVDDFALVSDMGYAAQNGGRIIRSLLEIAVSRKWANASTVLMGMSKAIEKRLWPFDQPLKQFQLKADVFYNLERWADELSPAELAAMSAADIGKLVHLNENHGLAILNAAKQFPAVHIDHSLRPLGFDVLKIAVRVARAFEWSSKVHGSVEPFWLWVEDHEGTTILQLAQLVFRDNTAILDVDFVISVPQGKPPPLVTIRFVSERWMGAEDEVAIPLESLVMPSPSNTHTVSLDLPFLPLSVCRTPVLEDLFGARIQNFNAIQTQIFWSLIHTRLHSLVCAPTGCGKSLMGQILIWCAPRMTLLKASNNTWALLVTPRRSVSAELLSDLRLLSTALDIFVDSPSDSGLLTLPKRKTIRVVTAAQLLGALYRHNLSKSIEGLSLVVLENLEQLDPVYELSVSLLRHATQSYPTRFVGLSTSLNDPADLAAWLDVDPYALHSFRPRDRDQSLIVATQTFTIPQSAALFKAMAKPAHAAIQAVPGEQAIVFVPSRLQCFTVARDLITQCALVQETGKGYLPDGVSEDHLEYNLVRLQDRRLIDFVSQGVGIFHEGISRPDRNLMLQLFAEGVVRVLVTPRDACWTLPVRAATVVVMGTQYVHVEAEGGERQIRDYSLSELVRMQGRAVRHGASGHFHLFCQVEAKDTFMRFLNEGLPLESQLLETPALGHWYHDQKKSGRIKDKQQAVEALSFTFLARRIVSNPIYYDTEASDSLDMKLSRVADQLED